MRDGIEQPDHDQASREQRRANRRQSTRRRSSFAVKAGIESFRIMMSKMTSQTVTVVESRLLVDDEKDDLSLQDRSPQGNDDHQKDSDPQKRRKILRRPSGGSNLLNLLGDAIHGMDDNDYCPEDYDSDDDEKIDVYEYQDEALRGLIQFLPDKLNQLLQSTADQQYAEKVSTGHTPSGLMLLPSEAEQTGKKRERLKPSRISSSSKEHRCRRISGREKGTRCAPLPSSSLRSASSTSKPSSMRSQRSSECTSQPARELRTSTIGRLRNSSSLDPSSRRSSDRAMRRNSSDKRREHHARRPGHPQRSDLRPDERLQDSDETERCSDDKRRSSDREKSSSRPNGASWTSSDVIVDIAGRRSRARATSSACSRRPRESHPYRATSSSRSSDFAVGPNTCLSKHNSVSVDSDQVGRKSSRRRSSSCTARGESIHAVAMNSTLRGPTTPEVGRKKSLVPIDRIAAPPQLNRTPNSHLRRNSTSEMLKSRRREEKREREEVPRRRRTTGEFLKCGGEQTAGGQQVVACCDKRGENVAITHGEVELLQLVVESLPDGSSHRLSCERTAFPSF
jgi:hypothetical protein